MIRLKNYLYHDRAAQAGVHDSFDGTSKQAKHHFRTVHRNKFPGGLTMRSLTSLLAVVLSIAACDVGSTEPSAVDADYALTLFGDAGAALETTMGPQGPRPFDGRSRGFSRLPTELALTIDQEVQIAGLRNAFRTANASVLADLRSIMEAARAARAAGETREEVRTIRIDARPIAESLRPAVQTLHESVKALLTSEQSAWLKANRPPRRFGR